MTVDEYKRQLACNIETIKKVDGEALPHLYWYLTRYNGKMIQRLISIIELLKGIENPTLVASPNMWAAFLSVRHISEMGQDITKDFKTWQSSIIQLLALGLIYRHIPSQADEGNRYMADSIKRKRKHHRVISYLGVPSYTPDRLTAADTKAKQLRYSKVSTANMSKEAIIQIWGQNTANAIYQDTRTESPRNKEVSNALVKTAQALIKEKGYTWKKELLAGTAKQLHQGKTGHLIDYQREVTRLYNKLGRRILHDSGIRYHPPSGQDSSKYNLRSKQWIYTFDT